MGNGWDAEVVEAAATVVARHINGDVSTVAAAGRDESGQIHIAMNVFHFTGGPCAELALLGTVAATGKRLVSIVAVGREGRGVLPPCGRCRQVLLDLAPEIDVMLPDGRIACPADLLPASYTWPDASGTS